MKYSVIRPQAALATPGFIFISPTDLDDFIINACCRATRGNIKCIPLL